VNIKPREEMTHEGLCGSFSGVTPSSKNFIPSASLFLLLETIYVSLSTNSKLLEIGKNGNKNAF